MRRPGIEPGPHAWKARILTIELSTHLCIFEKNIYIILQSVGFEPTPPKRLLPESSALDHSAKTAYIFLLYIYILKIVISSYHGGNARFHLNSEVKHHWACLVLLWGTWREPYVIYDNIYIYIFYIKYIYS